MKSWNWQKKYPDKDTYVFDHTRTECVKDIYISTDTEARASDNVENQSAELNTKIASDSKGKISLTDSWISNFSDHFKIHRKKQKLIEYLVTLYNMTK